MAFVTTWFYGHDKVADTPFSKVKQSHLLNKMRLIIVKVLKGTWRLEVSGISSVRYA